MTAFYVNAFLLLMVDALVVALIKNDSQRRKWICILNSIQFILFLSLRASDVGNDTSNYISSFLSEVRYPGWIFSHSQYEIGFQIYVSLIAKIFSDPRMFLFITALFTIVPFGVLVYKYSSNCALSFFTYATMEFILFSTTGARQQIANAFVLASLIVYMSEITEKKKWIITYGLIFIAGFIHQSAWGFVLLYLLGMLGKTRINKNLFYIVTLVAAFFLRNNIMSFIMQYFYNEYEIGFTGAYSRMIITLLFLVVTIVFKNNILQYNKNGSTLIDAMYLSTFFFILALSVSASARMGRYFFLLLTLIIPEIPHCFVESNKQIINIMLGILLILLMFFLFPHNGLATYGYHFWN